MGQQETIYVRRTNARRIHIMDPAGDIFHRTYCGQFRNSGSPWSQVLDRQVRPYDRDICSDCSVSKHRRGEAERMKQSEGYQAAPEEVGQIILDWLGTMHVANYPQLNHLRLTGEVQDEAAAMDEFREVTRGVGDEEMLSEGLVLVERYIKNHG